MKGYLLDTPVWFWYLRANARLPNGLRGTIESSLGECWLSPASIWEFERWLAQGKVSIDEPLGDWLADAFAALPLNQAVLTNDVAIAASGVPRDITDTADRYIAASAMAYELTLLTTNEAFVRADWLETISA